ncbi:MAG: hypothetical protein ACI976_002057, partial [Aureispira sp.]
MRHTFWRFIGLKGVGAMLLLSLGYFFFTNGLRAMPFLGALAPKPFENISLKIQHKKHRFVPFLSFYPSLRS